MSKISRISQRGFRSLMNGWWATSGTVMQIHSRSKSITMKACKALIWLTKNNSTPKHNYCTVTKLKVQNSQIQRQVSPQLSHLNKENYLKWKQATSTKRLSIKPKQNVRNKQTTFRKIWSETSKAWLLNQISRFNSQVQSLTAIEHRL